MADAFSLMGIFGLGGLIGVVTLASVDTMNTPRGKHDNDNNQQRTMTMITKTRVANKVSTRGGWEFETMAGGAVHSVMMLQKAGCLWSLRYVKSGVVVGMETAGSYLSGCQRAENYLASR